MKKLLPTLLLCLAISTQVIAQSGKITLKGTVKNDSFDEISINTLNDRPLLTASLDDNSAFEIQGKIERGYYFLSYGRESAYLYLSPKDDLTVSFDATDMDSTLKFSGKGSERNNYLAKKFILKSELTKDVETFYSKDENVFLANLRSQKNQISSLLGTFQVESFFKTDEKQSLDYDYLLNIQNYEQSLFYNIGEEINATAAFYKPLDAINFRDLGDYNKDPFYRYLIDSHWRKRIDEQTSYEAMNKVYRSIRSNDLRVSMLINFFSKISSSKDKAQDYLKLIKENTSSQEFVDMAEKQYNTLSTLKSGDTSPNFTYKNISGESVSLSDFLGKVVYIDVWATWCAPCIKQIPYIKQLEKDFHGKDIVFVSISVDKKEVFNKWERMVVAKNLTGVQLFADNSFESDFMNTYAVNSIPRFIIIDRKGNIVDPDAPSPSFEKTKGLLQSLLDK
ncbi:MAG: thioredoxin [Flavobacteriaceae bacterium]|nr:thioredoxin [Flavobacteriaceae bacterium]|tara:strand:+ start:1176 stop:2525 length:1350 start_codon:yes stop_codon:yes gene_type:complete